MFVSDNETVSGYLRLERVPRRPLFLHFLPPSQKKIFDAPQYYWNAERFRVIMIRFIFFEYIINFKIDILPGNMVRQDKKKIVIRNRHKKKAFNLLRFNNTPDLT